MCCREIIWARDYVASSEEEELEELDSSSLDDDDEDDDDELVEELSDEDELLLFSLIVSIVRDLIWRNFLSRVILCFRAFTDFRLIAESSFVLKFRCVVVSSSLPKKYHFRNKFRRRKKSISEQNVGF